MQVREGVLRVLAGSPAARTNWELQRLLLFTEKFDFIEKMPRRERTEVCRHLGVVRCAAGGVLCEQVRAIRIAPVIHGEDV